MGGLFNIGLGGLLGQPTGFNDFLMNNAQQGKLGLIPQFMGNMMPKKQGSSSFNSGIDPFGFLRSLGLLAN